MIWFWRKRELEEARRAKEAALAQRPEVDRVARAYDEVNRKNGVSPLFANALALRRGH